MASVPPFRKLRRLPARTTRARRTKLPFLSAARAAPVRTRSQARSWRGLPDRLGIAGKRPEHCALAFFHGRGRMPWFQDVESVLRTNCGRLAQKMSGREAWEQPPGVLRRVCSEAAVDDFGQQA